MNKPSTLHNLGLLGVGIVAYICAFPISFSDSAWLISLASPVWILIYLLPLLYYLKQNPSKSFLRIWLFFFLGSMGALHWIVISMRNYGNLSWSVSFAALVGTCLFRSLFPALAIYLWHRLHRRTNMWALGAILMTLQDLLLHYIPFGGFPWLSAGYALTPDLLWIQAADMIGIHGLNITIYLVVFLLFSALTATEKTRALSLKTFTNLRSCSFLMLLLGVHLYGGVSLLLENRHEPVETKSIGWVQGNINQAMKWDPREKKAIIEKYHDRTKKLFGLEPDLVVWPEAAIPRSFKQQTTLISESSVPGLTTNLLFGAPSYVAKDKQKIFYNSAFLSAPDGKIIQRYDKIFLVPFGEFVPNLGFDVGKYFPSVAGSFSSGEIIEPMMLREDKFGVSVCYEVLYTRLFQELAQKGSLFFINITNDAWFDFSSGPFQHARFAKIRAIETRKEIVRVANTGISALYHSDGTVSQQTQLFEEDIRIVEVQLRDKNTIFVRFPYGYVIFLLALGLICVKDRIRHDDAA